MRAVHLFADSLIVAFLQSGTYVEYTLDFLDNIFGTHVILCADIRFYLVQHLHRSVT